MAEREETATPQETEEAPVRGGKTKIFIFAAIGVVLVLGGAGLGVLLDGGSKKEAPEASEVANAWGSNGAASKTREASLEKFEVIEETAHDAEEVAEPEPIGPSYQLETFIVNITDRDRDRYLKIKAELELSNDRVAKELDSRTPHIRDLVISLLGSQSFEEVRSIEGKDILREEILQRINAVLTTGKARRIFFTEFVVQ